MFDSLVDIRPGERRTAVGALLTLFGIVSGHVVLETARDALFLSSLPASRLPWTYLGIALISLVLFAIERRSQSESVTSRAGLAGWLLAAGVITLGFWVLVTPDQVPILYAIYIWTGVVSTLVIVRFWTLAGDYFSISQAKRLFAFIGLGSILGAVAGSGLARVMVENSDPRTLVLVAATIFTASALIPMLLMPKPPERDRGGAVEVGRENPWTTLKRVRQDPYSWRVAAIILLSTMTFTLIDFLFKALVAENVAPERLGSYFANAYLIFNLFSLLAQLVLVRYLVVLVRRLKIDQFLCVLPGLILLGAGAIIAGLGLSAALGLKGLDGALRHSLHRTSTEMLYVPMRPASRGLIKGIIDVFGQRGGQALASILILVLAAVSAPLPVIAGLVILMTLGWAFAAHSMRPHYLSLFRRNLSEDSIESRINYPELDLASLEALIRSLNSADDGEVIAAIDLLAEQKRTDLIPALILYHPSRDVVIRSLTLFANGGRDDAVSVIDRLFDHESPEVRAAALRARSWIYPDAERIETLTHDPSPIVRAAALVGMISFTGSAEAQRIVLEQIESGREDVQLAMAEAIRFSPSPSLDEPLIALARAQSLRVRRKAAIAMRGVRSVAYVPALLEMLAFRDLRPEARATLVAIGPDALNALELAMGQRWLDPRIRHHLPRSIHRFGVQQAVDILIQQLPDELDPTVEHKTLRALGRLADDRPDLDFDAETLARVATEKLRHTFRLLDWEDRIRTGGELDSKRRTESQELLMELLREKHSHELEHVFRLLGVLYREVEEDFREMYRGASGADPRKSASARELLEDILDPPLREPLLLVVDDIPPRMKLERVESSFYTKTGMGYEEVLMMLLSLHEIGLRCVVAYHVGELGLTHFVPVLESLPSDREGVVNQTVENALAKLRSPLITGGVE